MSLRMSTRSTPATQPRQPSPNECPVPPPTPAARPTLAGSQNRTDEKAAARHSALSENVARLWKKNVPVYRIPGVRKADLHSRPKNTKKGLEEAQKKIAEMKDLKADVGSMLLVDEDGEPLVAVFAHAFPSTRVGVDMKIPSTIPLYPGSQGRTSADVQESTPWDGLQKASSDLCHLHTQELFVHCPPVAKPCDVRHPNDVLMPYPESYIRYQEEVLKVAKPQRFERAASSHYAHAWTPQGKPKDPPVPSQDMVKGSFSSLAISKCIEGTEPVNKEVRDRLKVSFPKDYDRYTKVFKSGKFNMLDSGPFLARAIVWKQQVEVHTDKNDAGPAAIFPLGYYTGGALRLPDFGITLGYSPRTVVIFLAGDIYHEVEEWEALEGPVEEGVSPGRLAYVFFCPKDAYTQLAGKKPLWNMRSLSGRSTIPEKKGRNNIPKKRTLDQFLSGST